MYTIARLHKTRDQSKIYTELSVGQLGKERLMIEVIKSISSFFYAFPKIADIKRGIVLLSVPRVEALALPIIVELITSEPTLIWNTLLHGVKEKRGKYGRSYLQDTLHTYRNTVLVIKHIPGTFIVAEFKTIIVSLQDYDSP